MKGFNKVILAGNLTRDPETVNLPRGGSLVKFGIALNRSWKDQASGEQKEEVTFVDVDAFGKTADAIGKFLRKGSSVLIEGRLKMDSWDDKKTGDKRSKLGVVAEGCTFLGGKDEGEQAQAPREKAETKTAPAAVEEDSDSTIPF